jgi:hypothetical protein
MATTKIKKSTKKTTAEEPKKNSNTLLIVIIVLLVLFFVIPGLILGVGGFLIGGKINKFAKQAEKGEVNLNLGGESVSLNTSQNQTWPSTAPSTVPQLKAGKITSAAKIGDAWSITYGNVKASDFNSYVSSLVAAGYTMDETSDLGTMKNGGGVKAGYRVNITYTEDDKGAGSILIGIAKETAPTE